jgi:hypothetical protein
VAQVPRRHTATEELAPLRKAGAPCSARALEDALRAVLAEELAARVLAALGDFARAAAALELRRRRRIVDDVGVRVRALRARGRR